MQGTQFYQQTLTLPAPTILLIQGLGELIDAGGDLQSLIKNLLLTLQSDVLWPANISSEIPLWLDSSTCKQLNLNFDYIIIQLHHEVGGLKEGFEAEGKMLTCLGKQS